MRISCRVIGCSCMCRLLTLLTFLISQPELNLKMEKPDSCGNEDVEQLAEGLYLSPEPQNLPSGGGSRKDRSSRSSFDSVASGPGVSRTIMVGVTQQSKAAGMVVRKGAPMI